MRRQRSTSMRIQSGSDIDRAATSIAARWRIPAVWSFGAMKRRANLLAAGMICTCGQDPDGIEGSIIPHGGTCLQAMMLAAFQWGSAAERSRFNLLHVANILALVTLAAVIARDVWGGA